MSRAKNVETGSIDTIALPPSATIECENVTVDLLMDFLNEQKYGAPSFAFGHHDHASYELTIVEEGSITIHIENEALTVTSGELLLIPPHTKHRIVSFTSDMRRFCIRFNINTDAQYIRTPPPGFMLDVLAHEERASIFSLISELRRPKPSVPARLADYRMKLQFGIIFSYILERILDFDFTHSVENTSQINLYTKIENYLYLNYSQQLTLDSLAEYLSYSRTQMRRIINDCFGMPFTVKLREIRLNAAKNHLAASNMPIDEISERCGYETRQGFESMFQKYVGVTPNQYRRRSRTDNK